MLKALKPFAGPFVLVLFEVGAGMSNFSNPFFGGLLIGIAVFWFVMALFSNRALLKRMPFLLEWMPFLDPTGGLRSEKSALTGKYIQGHSFNILDVSHNGKVFNRHFEDCDIYGPAVLFIEGVGHIVDAQFEGPREGVVITADQQWMVGPVHVKDCTFKNVRFHGIGVIGTKAMTDHMNAAFRASQDDSRVSQGTADKDRP